MVSFAFATAFAPMPVAKLRFSAKRLAFAPRSVLLLPMLLAVCRLFGNPVEKPTKVLSFPVFPYPAALTPKKVFSEPVCIFRPASTPINAFSCPVV